MAMSTRFTEHAGVEHPIICGAMYPCSNPELVAAASAGGGLAIMQPVSLTFVHGHDLREGIRLMRSLTDKPIGRMDTLAMLEVWLERFLAALDSPSRARLAWMSTSTTIMSMSSH